MQSARAMQGALDGKGQLKRLCLQKEVQKKRATYALAAETTKCMKVLDDLLDQSGFYASNATFWPCLARVMCYDVLFGTGLKGNVKTGPGYAVKKHSSRLKKVLAEVLKKKKLENPKDLISKNTVRIPIYLRVNSLLAKVEEVVAAFEKEGWTQVEPSPEALLEAAKAPPPVKRKRSNAEPEEDAEVKRSKEASGKKGKKKKSKKAAAEEEEEDNSPSSNKRKIFYRDPTLTGLLVFPPSAKFALVNHRLMKTSRVVIQDKASCLPPYILLHCLEMTSILNVPKGEEPKPAAGTSIMGPVLDATAAPGNKTSILSALSNGRRPIVAVEKDSERVEILKERLEKMGASARVNVVNRSFLDIFPHEFPNIEGIMLDPSCSGSGIVDRIEATPKSKEEEDKRIAGLASFQTAMIQHAMTFPAVRRIVYSTCSVNQQENEEVIREVFNDEAIKANWVIADIMPGTWGSRALPLFQDSQNCIRYELLLLLIY